MNLSTRSKRMLELQPEERKIIELKYAGKRFCDMIGVDRLRTAKALLVRIHAITGWIIPEAELKNVLIDQLTKTIEEKYSKMTSEEIEYAMRNFGTEIQDWGKMMNLSLIDQAVQPYLTKRRELSNLEEQIVEKKLIEQKEDLSDKSMIDWLINTKQNIEKEKWDWKWMPVSLYDFLVRKKKFHVTQMRRYEFLREAGKLRLNSLIENFDNSEASRKYIYDFKDMLEKGVVTSKTEIDKINRICKQLYLYNWLCETYDIQKEFA
ncbi:MAG: hypothetical protein JST87_05410 [Bacteroidetes bacterium]|nr:hypothetical protein [Bacteroidota bacterium]